MEIIDVICEAAQKSAPNADIGLIRRSYDFAKERHAGQMRRSGEPYWCTRWGWPRPSPS